MGPLQEQEGGGGGVSWGVFVGCMVNAQGSNFLPSWTPI